MQSPDIRPCCFHENRPELIRDIEKGLISKVVVYKLDRISRSILDFANMMELFQKYNVEFVSSTEKFDTSAVIGGWITSKAVRVAVRSEQMSLNNPSIRKW
ncbi:recombinase family protein [Anaerosporomusa subterranea]|uniref:recombinase family protein n=1 Tax=Anaerosporomusa subterranea TaxID=1794912 RepID=UPI0038B3873E